MKVSVTDRIPAKLDGVVAVLPNLEGEKGFSGSARSFGRRILETADREISRSGSRGKEGETTMLHPDGKGMPGAVVVIGVGKTHFTAKAARKYAANAVKMAAADHRTKVILALPDVGEGEEADILCAVTEGALLGGYSFMKYKSEEEKTRRTRIVSVTAVVGAGMSLPAARRGVKRGEIYARATEFARELVNEPAGQMTPARLVEEAKSIAASHPESISLKVFDRAELKKMKAGGLLGVAQGSDEPPYMVHLTYKPAGTPKARVALVGKGLTFDSGGLSLKPSDAMEDMKIDMSGAAAVLGAMSVMSELAPDVEVEVIAGLCENMPSGKAVKPGDILTTMSGKTVEILNTDAEGRVTLADTLHYAAGLKPDFIIDLATLTGACMVALGQEVSGLMSNSDGLADRLLDASESEGEMVWRLPLPEEYEALVKSPVADLKNISGTRYGGAITAGLFLQNFVGDHAWAHLDIAGPAWAEKDTVPHQPRGATGFGVRTVLRFVESL